MDIVPLIKEHYPQVANIYSQGLETGIATFETTVPDWNAWDAKFLREGRFVALEGTQVVGWCALTPTSRREVYRGVVENTLYVASEHWGKGIGKALLQHLIAESEALGFWTLYAAIFPQNEASIQLHKNCGFRIIGTREKIAQRDGVWYDNVLMERRSKKI